MMNLKVVRKQRGQMVQVPINTEGLLWLRMELAGGNVVRIASVKNGKELSIVGADANIRLSADIKKIRWHSEGARK